MSALVNEDIDVSNHLLNEEPVSFAAYALPQSTLTIAIFFLVNFIVLLFYQYKDKKEGFSNQEVISKNGRIANFTWTYFNILSLSKEIFVLGLIIGYCWICENKPFFSHEQKDHIPDFFWFICFAVLFFSFGSVHHDPKSNDIANRLQSEEWKGWMQTVFLLYHYFHASEVYNSVRVMISCYVWLTGFGNLQFFYVKQDYGFVRFAQMMWRLNFSVVFLCLAMNNMYMLYYICPLHTFYFLLTYFSMRVFKSVNYTRWGLRIKLFVIGILIYAIWEFQPVFDVVFGFLPNTFHPGAAVAAYGVKYEWHFRSGLDHYSTYFGMIFALNITMASMWISKVEALPKIQEIAVKTLVGLVFSGLFLWWATVILPMKKIDFNVHNPYMFLIPLLTYLYFRNITPYLRQVHLGILATIGKYTLETYLMQHHIWLTSNAKTILVFIPNSPKINLILVTAIYFTVARRLYKSTMITRAMLVPDQMNRALYFLGIIAGSFGVLGLISTTLQIISANWLVVILFSFTLSFGLIYIMNSKVINFSKTKETENNKTKSLIVFFVGSLICLLGICLGPMFIPTGAEINKGPLRPIPRKATNELCLESLGIGEWSDLNGKTCKQISGPYCHGLAWSWSNHILEKQCKFREIDSLHATEMILKRNIMYLGDETLYDILGTFHTSIDVNAGRIVTNQLSKDSHEIIRVNLNKLADNYEGKIKFQYVDKVKRLGKQIQALNGQVIDVLVLGTWYNDSKDKQDISQITRLWEDTIQIVNNQKNIKSLVLVTPPEIVKGKLVNAAIGNVLMENAHKLSKELMKKSNKNVFILPYHKLSKGNPNACVDGYRYSESVNLVASQLLLNAFKHFDLPVIDLKGIETKSNKPKKGSGGGVAINPIYGLIVLGVAFLMLVTMDIHAGISFFFLRVIPTYPPKITWEESVKPIHHKMGLGKSYEKVSKDSDQEVKEFALDDMENANLKPRKSFEMNSMNKK